MSKKDHVDKLHAVVCPKQKKVKIMIGHKVVKTYNFKMDIPSKRVKRCVFVHDYSVWSVADRDSIEWREDTVYDSDVMQSVRDKALQYYKTYNP